MTAKTLCRFGVSVLRRMFGASAGFGDETTLHKPWKASTSRLIAIVLLLPFAMPTDASAVEHMRFWNLTGAKITKLYLAPAGTTTWGPNQCANDADGSVDPDERLKLTGLAAGHYDVKLEDSTGRTCLIKDVTLQTGAKYAFSLSEADLKDCSK